MAKYRKKPIVIEAVQFFSETWDWCPARDYCDVFGCKCTTGGCPPGPHIHTFEGAYKVSEGDWLIIGIKGEKYLCKDKIFKQTYEKV